MPNDAPSTPPPSGDSKKADEYISKITKLLSQDKVTATHTDLTQYEPCSISDHYKIIMDSYEVEVSHTKQPDTNKDFFIMLFNNVRQFEGSNKLILAYIHLTNEQFRLFKGVADEQLARKKKEEEQRRFTSAMQPIDQILNEVSYSEQNPQPEAVTPILNPDQELPAHSQPPSYQPTAPSILQSFSTPPSSN